MYICILITQILFYFYNRPVIGDLSGAELPMLFWGSLKFSTISILYLNAPLSCSPCCRYVCVKPKATSGCSSGFI